MLQDKTFPNTHNVKTLGGRSEVAAVVKQLQSMQRVEPPLSTELNLTW